MTLLEHYRHAMRQLKGKEKALQREHWHRACKRYLNMLSLTADPIPPLHTNKAGVTTIPMDGFFLSFTPEDLIKTYRASKPVRKKG